MTKVRSLVCPICWSLDEEPHNTEEALRWLEQQMGAHVDTTYGTAIGVKMKRQ